MIENAFYEQRRHFQPVLPRLLEEIKELSLDEELCAPASKLEHLFPHTFLQPLVHFGKRGQGRARPLKVGVVLSGGQASGGHNVIAALFDGLKRVHSGSSLIGFLGGPSGIIENRFIELTEDILALYRNSGGFDLIGSGRTKIETEEQLALALNHCQSLDGLVIIGGDDSNTNAAILAESFLAAGCTTCVIGVPKTIDGDLKNRFIECSFGFDTACKIYSEMIGNICRDALSAKKYTHFIKLMGRSASHVTLECALQTHPNLALIGEEIAAKQMTLQQVAEMVADCIEMRAAAHKNYGVILIPEGLIEFIPECKQLIRELNALLAEGRSAIMAKLSERARAAFDFLPQSIADQLLLDRDPHGNVQVSHIATEQLLIDAVGECLKKRPAFKGKFSPLGHFYGYEGRCGYPSNFDANYCAALGATAAALIFLGKSSYMCALKNLFLPPQEWEPMGVPLTALMTIEERKGKKKPVIKKALVDLEDGPFQFFAAHRQEWTLEDSYRFCGPIQFAGAEALCNETTLTLQLEAQKKFSAKQ